MKKTIELILNNKSFSMEVEESVYNKFEEIFISNQNTIDRVLYCLVYRSFKENGLDWLFAAGNGELNAKSIKKLNAIKNFSNKYPSMNIHNTNFSSKNNNHDSYWINPNNRVLKNDWFIILNDFINHRLYLFCIPKEENLQFRHRSDTPQKLDLRIRYRDEDFTEELTGYKLKKYLIDTYEYKSLS